MKESGARFLFADTRMAWLWFIVRLYVGYEWLTAGWDKMTGYSISLGSFGEASKGGPWVFGGHDGAAIKGFVAGALAQTKGANPAVQGWYAALEEWEAVCHVADRARTANDLTPELVDDVRIVLKKLGTAGEMPRLSFFP